MKKIIYLMLIISALATFSIAQNSDDYKKVEFFAGYTLDQDLREANNRFTSILGFTPAQIQTFFGQPLINNSGRTKLNGANVSVTGYVNKYIGFTGDFSGSYKKENQAVGAQGSEVKRSKYTFQGGPQVKFRNSSRVQPFARALFGVTKTSNEIRPNNAGIPPTGLTVEQIDDNYSAFSTSYGGGVDVKINKKVSLRLIQVDYNSVFSKTRNLTVTNARLGGSPLTGATTVTGYRRDNVRLSFGIVF
jgi:hypothetical protein